MFDAVLFDLDGTLADTAPDLAAALNRVRAGRGLDPVPLAMLRPHTSRGVRGLLEAGMAVVPGGGSHNAGDFDRELMDSGPYRPFEERAELGDYQQRPSGFSMNHRAYLNQILPRD